MANTTTKNPVEVLANVQDRVIEGIRRAQQPVIDGVRRLSERLEGRLPELPDLPVDPAEVVDLQFEFAKRLVEVNHEFARELLAAAGLVEVKSPKSGRRTKSTGNKSASSDAQAA